MIVIQGLESRNQEVITTTATIASRYPGSQVTYTTKQSSCCLCHKYLLILQKDEERTMHCYISATAEKSHILTTQQKKGGAGGDSGRKEK